MHKKIVFICFVCEFIYEISLHHLYIILLTLQLSLKYKCVLFIANMQLSKCQSAITHASMFEERLNTNSVLVYPLLISIPNLWYSVSTPALVSQKAGDYNINLLCRVGLLSPSKQQFGQLTHLIKSIRKNKMMHKKESLIFVTSFCSN